MKLTKFKFQDPSFARAPSKALGGVPVICSRGYTFFLICKSKILEPLSVKCRQLIDNIYIYYFSGFCDFCEICQLL